MLLDLFHIKSFYLLIFIIPVGKFLVFFCWWWGKPREIPPKHREDMQKKGPAQPRSRILDLLAGHCATTTGYLRLLFVLKATLCNN